MIRLARSNMVAAAFLFAIAAIGCSDAPKENRPVGNGPAASAQNRLSPIAGNAPSVSPVDIGDPNAEAPPPVGAWRRYHEASGLTGADLDTVWMNKDFTAGWAVGNSGVVLRYADKKWERDEEACRATSHGLDTLAMSADGTEGWAGGNGGKAVWLRFTGGKWQFHESAHKEPAFGINAVVLNARGDDGWAFDSTGSIFRLEKGDWKQAVVGGAQLVDGKYNSPPKMHSAWLSADGLQGLAVGDEGTMLRLADGKWTKDEAASALDKGDLYRLAMSADGTTGWAVNTDKKIFRFEKGKWSLGPKMENEYWQVRGLGLSADGKTGWGTVYDGPAFRITDGEWKREESFTKEEVMGVVVSADGKRAMAVARHGEIFEHTDGKWQRSTLPPRLTPNDLNGIWMSDDGKFGWAVGRGVILKYADGAWSANFKDVNELFRFSLPDHNGVRFNPDGTEGWAVGAGAMHYENGKWTKVEEETGSSTMQTLWMSRDLKQGWAPCDNGVFMRYADGKWSKDEAASAVLKTVPEDIRLTDDGKQGWLVGEDLVLRFQDGSWTKDEEMSKLQNDFAGVTMKPDGTDGWLVADHGFFFRLRNGAWHKFKDFLGHDLQAVAMDEKFEQGFAVGSVGEIVRYAGGAWAKDPARHLASGTLNDIWLKADGSEGWAVGARGEIMRYTRNNENTK